MKEEIVGDAARHDLLMSESSAESLRHQVTGRAEIYVRAGVLGLDDVLDVLNISRATWYRRLEALRIWEQSQAPTEGGNA